MNYIVGYKIGDIIAKVISIDWDDCLYEITVNTSAHRKNLKDKFEMHLAYLKQSNMPLTSSGKDICVLKNHETEFCFHYSYKVAFADDRAFMSVSSITEGPCNF
jgi:hypothetical protein